MAKQAKWSHGVGSTKKVRQDGTAELVLPVLDAGNLAGTLTITLTAGRQLRVLWEAEPGAEPLAGFEAWSKEP
jgi:hypothetical protein